MNDRIVEKDTALQFISPCAECKNKFDDSPGCRAFETIPMTILLGKNKHTVPFPGQNNDIVFEHLTPVIKAS